MTTELPDRWPFPTYPLVERATPAPSEPKRIKKQTKRTRRYTQPAGEPALI